MNITKILIVCPGCGSVQSDSIKYCPRCGLRIVQSNHAVCPECGECIERGQLCAACGCVLTEQCVHCGADILGGENYCPACGGSLSGKVGA